MIYAIEALKIRFRKREDVYVSGDLFIYYEEGSRAASVAPDVFVVFGVPNHRRRTYLLWQESKAPDFVMDVASSSNPGGRSGA
jgi:Uma2 family endonuclease